MVKPDAVETASAVLAAGGSLDQAAEKAGVSRRTVERWRGRGRAELERAPYARSRSRRIGRPRYRPSH